MRRHVVESRPNWAYRMLARKKGRIFVCFFCWLFEGGGDAKDGDEVICFGCGRKMDPFRRWYSPAGRSGNLFKREGGNE